MMMITIKGVTITFDQMITLIAIQSVDPKMRWHPNECKCCIVVHTDHGHYLIGEDGNYNIFPLDAGDPK